jgi:phosphoglucomutase/phosphomannomutase-like protein
VIDRDNRESSTWIRDAVVRGLTSSGCDVVDIGTVITPVFYYEKSPASEPEAGLSLPCAPRENYCRLPRRREIED